MRFARWVFAICGIYGIIALAPLYFMETKLGRPDYPPAITHPRVLLRDHRRGAGLASRRFLVISTDPARYRPIMLTGVLEKLGYGVPAFILYFQGRSPSLTLLTGSSDLLMAVLFVVAAYFQRTASPAAATFSSPCTRRHPMRRTSVQSR